MWQDPDSVPYFAIRPRPRLRLRPIDCPRKTCRPTFQCHPVPLQVPPVQQALVETVFPGAHKRTKSFGARRLRGVGRAYQCLERVRRGQLVMSALLLILYHETG